MGGEEEAVSQGAGTWGGRPKQARARPACRRVGSVRTEQGRAEVGWGWRGHREVTRRLRRARACGWCRRLRGTGRDGCPCQGTREDRGQCGEAHRAAFGPQDGKETACPRRQEAGAAVGGDGCGEDPGSANSESYGEGAGAGTLLPQGSLPLYPSHSQSGTSDPARPLGRVENGSIGMGGTLWVNIFQQSSHEQPSPRGGGILEN